MRSAIGAPLPLIGVTGTWYHAATRGYPGRILRLTPSGFKSASGYEPIRFNPGAIHSVSSSFETLYLALDNETALFEKRVQHGDPCGDPSALLVAARIKNTVVVPVAVNLDTVLDLSDVGVRTPLNTSAQEITGDWRGYEKRGLGLPPPLGVLTTPIGLAPTQQLAWELFQDRRIKGIISISAKVPTTCCLVVFTHKLQPPDSLSWDDPNTGRQERYP
jgi:hypothetical protein